MSTVRSIDTSDQKVVDCEFWSLVTSNTSAPVTNIAATVPLASDTGSEIGACADRAGSAVKPSKAQPSRSSGRSAKGAMAPLRMVGLVVVLSFLGMALLGPITNLITGFLSSPAHSPAVSTATHNPNPAANKPLVQTVVGQPAAPAVHGLAPAAVPTRTGTRVTVAPVAPSKAPHQAQAASKSPKPAAVPASAGAGATASNPAPKPGPNTGGTPPGNTGGSAAGGGSAPSAPVVHNPAPPVTVTPPVIHTPPPPPVVTPPVVHNPTPPAAPVGTNTGPASSDPSTLSDAGHGATGANGATPEDPGSGLNNAPIVVSD
jgi:hypothetical protein